MLVKLAAALLFFSVLEQVVGSDNIDIYDSLPEKPAIQKGRLSLQNTGRRCVPVCYKYVDCRLGWCRRSHIQPTFVRTRVSEAGEEQPRDSSIPEFFKHQRSPIRNPISSKYVPTESQCVSKLLIDICGIYWAVRIGVRACHVWTGNVDKLFMR